MWQPERRLAMGSEALLFPNCQAGFQEPPASWGTVRGELTWDPGEGAAAGFWWQSGSCPEPSKSKAEELASFKIPLRERSSRVNLAKSYWVTSSWMPVSVDWKQRQVTFRCSFLEWVLHFVSWAPVLNAVFQVAINKIRWFVKNKAGQVQSSQDPRHSPLLMESTD